MVLAGVLAGCSNGGPRLHTLAANQAADGPASGKAVLDWNIIALRTTATAAFDPPRETRTLAMGQWATTHYLQPA